MRKLAIVSIIAASFVAAGCTRIESGVAGVRENFSKQIEPTELQPGTWAQTVVGRVLKFPIRDIIVQLDNKTPITSDNSPLADFDVTFVYSINQNSVAELFSTKNRSFHAVETDGDILLMHTRISQLVNNAAYKSVRQYKSLEVGDNREKIEKEIAEIVREQLKLDGAESSIQVTSVQIRNILPNVDIQKSATELVKSQNEIKIKENEVRLAKLEAERMQALSSNSQQSIAYLNAQANLNFSQAALNGKVQTLIVPHGMSILGTPAAK